jgi:hypothetical protein
MNIWVFMGSYDGELFATTHLTEKGAVLAALSDIVEYLGIAEGSTRICPRTEEDKPLPWDDDDLKALPTTELWEVYRGYCEHLWDDSQYEIEIKQTQVVG